MRIANRDSRDFVNNLRPFQGSNLHAENRGNLYIVYSYEWWPLWIYCRENKVWFENISKYSVTTSKQKSQSAPTIYASNNNLIQLNRFQMKALI